MLSRNFITLHPHRRLFQVEAASWGVLDGYGISYTNLFAAHSSNKDVICKKMGIFVGFIYVLHEFLINELEPFFLDNYISKN